MDVEALIFLMNSTHSSMMMLYDPSSGFDVIDKNPWHNDVVIECDLI